jgi:hypothetical protein
LYGVCLQERLLQVLPVIRTHAPNESTASLVSLCFFSPHICFSAGGVIYSAARCSPSIPRIGVFSRARTNFN